MQKDPSDIITECPGKNYRTSNGPGAQGDQKIANC